MTAQLSMSKLAAQYREQVQTLIKNKASPPPEQVLPCLIIRDQITHLWQKEGPPEPEVAHVIDEADNQLRALKEPISQLKELDRWRRNFNPPQEAWWWHFQPPEGWLQRFDWLAIALSLFFLTLAAGLITDITPRFLSGGPDAKGAMIVVIQSVVVLLTTSSVLTKAGQEMGRRILGSFKISKQWWQEIAALAAFMVLVALFIFRQYLPTMAVTYNDDGLADYCAGRLSSAKFNYERALKLNPDYLEAHYNLGQLHEDLQDLEQAKTHYQTALQGGLTAAYSSLARLYILEKDYDAAVPLLQIARQLIDTDQTKAEYVRCNPETDPAVQGTVEIIPDEILQYEVLKNLGWARLGQQRYAEAEPYLREAIKLVEDKAPAHCLLAQVLEGVEEAEKAEESWDKCIGYGSSYDPDEDTWLGLYYQQSQKETNAEGVTQNEAENTNSD